MLATMVWNASSGNYDVAANWTNSANPADHHIPISSDDAQINTSGITITHSSGTDSVNSLTDAGGLTLSGGTLSVAATLGVSRAFLLSGGTLSNATVTNAGGGLSVSGSSNTLQAVTLNTPLSMTAAGSGLQIKNGLALNSTITVTAQGNSLDFGATSGTSALLTGTGKISFDVSGAYQYGFTPAYLYVDKGITLTIDTGVTIEGRSVDIGILPNGSGTNAIVNNGTIAADLATPIPGGAPPPTTPVQIQSSTFVNGGHIQVSNGGALNLVSGTWSSTRDLTKTGSPVLSPVGTIVAMGSTTPTVTTATVYLGGTFTTADVGPITQATNASIVLTGTWDNTGSTVTLESTSGGGVGGNLVLQGGLLENTQRSQIANSTVTTANGSKIIVSGSSGNTLQAITLNAPVDETSGGAALHIENDLKLNSTITVTAQGNSLDFGATSGTSALLTGTGKISFDVSGAYQYGFTPAYLYVDKGITLTIDTGVTIEGRSVDIGILPNGSGTNAIVNNGTIAADLATPIPGGAPPPTTPVQIQSSTFVNGGHIQVSNGGALNLVSGTWSSARDLTKTGSPVLSPVGTITAMGSTTPTVTTATVYLGGTFTTADVGPITQATNASIVLTGTWDNTGSTVTLESTSGGGVGGNLVLQGGLLENTQRSQIANSTVTTANGSKIIVSGSSGNTLQAITLDAPVNETSGNAVLHIKNDLVLNSTITVTAQGNHLVFDAVSTNLQSLTTTNGLGKISFDVTGPNGYAFTPAFLNVEGGTTLSIGQNVTVDGRSVNIGGTYTVGGATTIINLGTISADVATPDPNPNLVSSPLLLQASTLTNSGVLIATASGTLTIAPATFTNLAAGVLTGGTLSASSNGIIRGFNSGIATNAATIALGSGAHFYTGTSGTTDALAGLTLNSAAGNFTIQTGEVFTAASGFSNAGSLIIASGGTFDETGTYVQSVSTGVTEVDGSLKTTNSTVSITGGTLSGTGTVTANVTNAAIVAPGDSPGILTISGNYMQSSTGALNVEIRGTNAATPDFDQLHISGTATLAGTLNVALLNGFTPGLGNTFNILSFSSRSGSFDSTTGVTNGNGHLAPTPGATSFALVNSAGSLSWTGNVSTDWDTAANWDLNRLPTATDDVVIPVTAARSPTHGSGTDSVDSVTASLPLLLSGGILTVHVGLTSTSSITLASGTLASAIVASGTTVTGTTSGGTLDGVTFAGVLDLTTAAGANATVKDDLILSGGSINIGSPVAANPAWGYLSFASTESLRGIGTVTLHNGANSALNTLSIGTSRSTLTITNQVLVHGSGVIGFNGNPSFTGAVSPNVSIINQGTVNADVSGGLLIIDGTNWRNDTGGQLEVQSGAVLDLGIAGSSRPWSNAGTINVSGGTLNLYGTMTTAGVGTFTRNGGTVNLGGTLNNNNATFTLDATTGSWNLAAGSIMGGAITTVASAALVATTAGGTLDGTTLSGVLDLATANGVNVNVIDNLTLSGGSVNIGSTASGNSPWGYLTFTGSEQVKGNGTITLNNGGNSALNTLLVASATTTLTISSGVVIHGSGVVGFNSNVNFPGGGSPNVGIINQGTIDADVNGGTLAVNGTNWQNAATGRLKAENGGTLLIQGTFANFASGTLSGGTYDVFASSTIRGFSSVITTDAATILLSGTNSNMFVGATGTVDALANLASIAAGASFSIQAGRNFTAQSGFSNAGTLIIGVSTTFTQIGSYNQTIIGAVTQIDGTLTCTLSGFTNAAMVKGKGTINSNVTNGGTIAPGDSPGTLTIAGDYTQTSSGILDLEIAGTDLASNQYDRLVVGGTASLAGSLDITFLNNFSPSLGDTFSVMSFATRTGSFSTENGVELGNDSHLSSNFTADSLPLIDVAGTIAWTGDTGTDWNDAANWDLGRTPIPMDDVVIPANVANAVVYSSGTAVIGSLEVNAPLTLSGGTLDVTGTVTLTATLTFAGGSLADATVAGSGAGKLVATTDVGSTLQNVTLAAPLDMTAPGSFLHVGSGVMAEALDFREFAG